MHSIRKKMQSLKLETETMEERASIHEASAISSNKLAEKCEAQIRDLGKKIVSLETRYDECLEGLLAAISKEDERNKKLHLAEEENGNLVRRMLLLEEEVKRRETELGKTVVDLCQASTIADSIAKRVKILQTKSLQDEINLEESDKDYKEAKFMAEDADRKYDEIARRMGIMEDELRRALDRAAHSEQEVQSLESDLKKVGESMKHLEVSEEKILSKEDSYENQINNLMNRLKMAISRAEYGDMTITKLNHRIDDLEDDIVREKMKIKYVSDELDCTLEDLIIKTT